MTLPPKFHACETHIVQFLERHSDGTMGLGAWTEQAFEAAHHLFKQEWSRVKVDVTHPDCGQHLLGAVIRFNSSHI